MHSNSKARISGLAANTHAQNRTLPDLPSAWPWEVMKNSAPETTGYEYFKKQNDRVLKKIPLMTTKY